MRRSIALGVLCAALLLPPQARAQSGDKVKAKALYDKGNVQYNLGRWKEAIDLFTQAYEAYDNPDLLFNIGQAYRQDGNCSRAIFFYKRYLALKPAAPNRSEVEKFIAKLQPGCVEQPETKPEPKPDPPEVETEPKPERVAEVKDPPEEPEIEEDGEEEAAVAHPRIVSLRAAAGGSILTGVPSELKPGLLFALSAGAAYPIHVGEVGIEPGVLVTFTPVPWDRSETGASGTIGLTGLMANGGLTYALGSGFGLRGDVGLGVLVISGLGETENPFLEMGDTASGALSKFHLRIAAGLEYAVAPSFILSAQPVVSYSPSSDLRSDIKSITRFEFLIGAGYRM